MGTILVTGSRGFIGRYLCQQLERKGWTVIRAGQPGDPDVEIEFDICSQSSILPALSGRDFQVVIHLAAVSSVDHPDSGSIYRTNVIGTLNLATALDQLPKPPAKLVAISSAAVYGDQQSAELDEGLETHPTSDYGISKLAVEKLLLCPAWKFEAILVRLFNTTGVGQSPRFVIAKCVKHFLDRSPTIHLGNTHTVREYNDVRDIAATLERIVRHCNHSTTVNVCSGEGVSLNTVIDNLRRISGHDIEVLIDDRFVRPSDPIKVVGSTRHLESLIGEIEFRNLDSTLRSMINGEN